MKVIHEASFRTLLEPQIKQVEQDLFADLEDYEAVLIDAATHLFNAGGKRLRPILSFLTARVCGGEITRDHIILATSLEILHTATLIHDDVIDMSDLRRGMPSVNFKWNNKISILAGDFLLSKASYNLTKINNSKLNRLFAKSVMDMCNAEIMQFTQAYDPDTTFPDYLKKTELKTASLMAMASQAAAVLSDSDYEKDAYNIGLNIGMAFQIKDDILDFSHNQKTGKPEGNDLLTGQLTAPVLYALSSGKGGLIRNLIKNKFSEPHSIDEAVDIIKSSGSIDKAMELANNYTRLAYESLNNIPFTPSHELLAEYIEFVLDRNY